MKFAYQTLTKQYNDQWHAVCITHEFVLHENNTYKLQLRRQCIKIRFMLHVSIIRIG